jgi:hypothetical protein
MFGKFAQQIRIDVREKTGNHGSIICVCQAFTIILLPWICRGREGVFIPEDLA